MTYRFEIYEREQVFQLLYKMKHDTARRQFHRYIKDFVNDEDIKKIKNWLKAKHEHKKMLGISLSIFI
ncbi:hypothetical protein AB996_1243 [Lactococcus cremoris]|uniref:Uncharacterized protein n=1 Tax=Lactococcus lactis subsp. cremoris TaxID=1359 RepID=A0A166JP61_LACLC|nr:hypothetical protein [Lactococcus cremoris]KZK06467.1 hypothetical protein AB996_1243 [Lactococcus cremoris]